MPPIEQRHTFQLLLSHSAAIENRANVSLPPDTKPPSTPFQMCTDHNAAPPLGLPQLEVFKHIIFET